ncbi:MAG: hypothetical protein NC223_00915 [Butyrivibrio sp.]|nr:hypothetical protein [Butyrivibrio sp.]
MYGHFGFSYIGLIFLLLLFIPNIIWTKNIPQGYSAENESRLLLVFERIGEASVSCLVLIFSDFNLHGLEPWSLWLAAAFFLMALYELWWLRYFRGEKTLRDFYRSFMGIPLPGAVLPVAAFFLLGVYGRVIWLPAAAAILGVGHIGIHWQHYRALDKQ